MSQSLQKIQDAEAKAQKMLTELQHDLEAQKKQLTSEKRDTLSAVSSDSLQDAIKSVVSDAEKKIAEIKDTKKKELASLDCLNSISDKKQNEAITYIIDAMKK